MSRTFTKFAWAVLGWNMLVVLWGAVVRATGSGAGCGSHWPLCNGEVVPPSPAITTIIEFTHRMTSGLALIGVLALWIMARRIFPKAHPTRRFAWWSLVFILIEAALGAGLVLFNLVEKNASVGRAVYLSAHLANTQILLGMLAMTAWTSRAAAEALAPRRFWPLLAGTLPVALIVGISGAIAALGDTLFPASSISHGIEQDLSTTTHFLVRLRVFHPLIAILAAGYISLAVLRVKNARISSTASTLAMATWGTVALQLIVGAVNVVLLAPVWMQILHLFVANVMWILLVLTVAEGSREAAPASATAPDALRTARL